MLGKASFKGLLSKGLSKEERKFLVPLVSGFGAKDQTGVRRWPWEQVHYFPQSFSDKETSLRPSHTMAGDNGWYFRLRNWYAKAPLFPGRDVFWWVPRNGGENTLLYLSKNDLGTQNTLTATAQSNSSHPAKCSLTHKSGFICLVDQSDCSSHPWFLILYCVSF